MPLEEAATGASPKASTYSKYAIILIVVLGVCTMLGFEQHFNSFESLADASANVLLRSSSASGEEGIVKSTSPKPQVANDEIITTNQIVPIAAGQESPSLMADNTDETIRTKANVPNTEDQESSPPVADDKVESRSETSVQNTEDRELSLPAAEDSKDNDVGPKSKSRSQLSPSTGERKAEKHLGKVGPEEFNGTNGVIMKLSDVANGTLELIAIKGWPLCYWQNACFVNGYFWKQKERYTDLVTEESERRFREITLTTAAERGCLSNTKLVSRFERFATFNESETEILYVKGTTVVIDTFARNYPHFGHVVGKVFQFFNIRRVLEQAIEEDSNGTKTPNTLWFNNHTLFQGGGGLRKLNIDQVAMLTQNRFPSRGLPNTLALTQIVLKMFEKFATTERSLYTPERKKYPVICFERSLEARMILERFAATENEVTEWVDFVSKEWKPWSDGKERGKCMSVDASVIMLQRRDGQGLRRIWNIDVVIDVLLDLGIICNRSEFNMMGYVHTTSLGEQAQLFKSYALLLSTHSSQLKNVAFAHPHSITVEIKPGNHFEPDIYARYPSPFCTNNLCPSIYWNSVKHDLTRQSLTTSFNVTADILKRDLEQLLQKQREVLTKAGCPLLNIHDRKRCGW